MGAGLEVRLRALDWVTTRKGPSTSMIITPTSLKKAGDGDSGT